MEQIKKRQQKKTQDNIKITVPTPPKNEELYSKEQADSLTKDYTPQMFLGDVNNLWSGSQFGLKELARENAPQTLQLGGHTFRNMGEPFVTFEQTSRSSGKDIIMFNYQSDDQVGKEYPVLQVGIRVWRTKGGKVKSEIIRDGYTNKTRFW